MIERPGELGFTQEAPPVILGVEALVQELDGDVAIEARVVGKVDDTHPAGPQAADDAIRADRFGWRAHDRH